MAKAGCIHPSFQEVRFVADEITLERVGVSISGLAVYRIAEPLLAFRVLNFSYPERAQEKLEQTLTEMLMGATRRLVANLTVDECLQPELVGAVGARFGEVNVTQIGGGQGGAFASIAQAVAGILELARRA